MKRVVQAKGEVLGHCIVGRGAAKAIVLHDWIGDSTNWDPMLPFLNETRLCWALTDLRGYGRSQAIAGDLTLDEATVDVLATADALGWERFAVVGHSMSSLIALTIGQHFPERVDRLVIVAPCPPGGIRSRCSRRALSALVMRW
jgi:3-oxoadipate enol-lactonase